MENCETKVCKEATFLEEKLGQLSSNNTCLMESVVRIKIIHDKLKGYYAEGEDENEESSPNGLMDKLDGEIKQYHSLNDRLNSLISNLENII